MGIEATGDPFWWDGLTDAQQDAVLGMMWREWKDEEEAVETKPKPSQRPAIPTPSNATTEAWAALMSHPGAQY